MCGVGEAQGDVSGTRMEVDSALLISYNVSFLAGLYKLYFDFELNK